MENNTLKLAQAYEEVLSLNDMNDTLIIRGKKLKINYQI